MARKGILKPDISKTARRAEPRGSARGSVGALQSSLSRLRENAVQDIDSALIDEAGLDDRLSIDIRAQAQLKESLRTYGQQVPILLRPHREKPGRFEIVYGRRRLHALKELGLPVKAMVRQLDDHALVLAQGQENTARQDLSFIEKASFAAQLQAADYDRQTIADALSIDLPMVSRMLKVGCTFDLEFLRKIGSAPGIGRDRWMQLVTAFKDKSARSRAYTFMNRPEFLPMTSDERFEAILARALHKPRDIARTPAAQSRTLRAPDGAALADIRTSAKAVTLNIKSGAFAAWVDAHAEDVLNDLHDRWTKDRSEEAD